MLLWIYDLPTWLLALFILAFFLTTSLGGLLLSRRLVTKRLVFSREINDAVNYFGTAIAAMYSVTLGLIAVASWSNFSNIQGLVSKEASTIGVLYRDAGGYPEPLRTELRQMLRTYTLHIIDKSWPAQQHGLLDDESTTMVTDIHQKMMDYRPPDLGAMALHGEALHKFNEMADLRRQRADRVNDALPGVLWSVLIFGAILMLMISYLFWIADVRFHLLLQGMLTVFIALMIFLIAALDRPFRGEVSVSSDSYTVIVKRLMDPLDAHTAH